MKGGTANEFSLEGKTILITGASSGIGKAASVMAARYGATLILTGRHEERLAETRRLAENQPVIHTADLTVTHDMDALIERVPVLDGIVHCAGIVGPYPARFVTQDDIDRMFSINYSVPVNLTSKLIRKKKVANGASLVFMSTIATRNPYFGGALYSGSKAALEAFAKTIALEMAGKGIRANCIMAGLVDTPMIENPSEPGMQEEALSRYLKRYPLGIGQPDDVAAAIVFLLAPASKWISGTTLIMGGE